MNPLLIALRRGSAPVAVPVMVLLGWWAGARGDSFSVDWGWASGQLQQHGVLLVPLTAAIAAWDASRDRRTASALLVRTYPRSPLPWLLLNCVGALLAGLLGWVATFAVMATGVRGSGTPYWSVVLLGPLCLVAAVLLGAVAGRHLPRHLAAPLAAGIVWLALAFGSTSTDPMIARLSAVDRECCDVASEPVPATVAGQWLWVLGVAAAAMAVLALPRRRHVVVPVLVAVATMTTGVVLIQSTGGRLTEARAATVEVCDTREGVTVCLWPEHATDVAAWLDATSRYRVVFADIGPQPPLYLEHGLRPGVDAPRIGPIRPGTTEFDLVVTLAWPLYPLPPGCAAIEGGSGPYPAASANTLLSAWLRWRIRPDAPLRDLVPPDQLAQLEHLTTAPTDRQVQWYRDLVEAHRDCTTPPPAVP